MAKFPWTASGRALTFDRTDGVTKMLVDPETERVLGVGITGAGAGELIAEAVLAMEMGATVEDIALTIHAAPDVVRDLDGMCRRLLRPRHAHHFQKTAGGIIFGIASGRRVRRIHDSMVRGVA